MDKRAAQKGQGSANRLKLNSEEFVLTPMSLEDIAEISNLEKQSFSLPWSKDDFREITLSQLYKSLVARGPQNKILGYIVFYLAADEGHVMNVVSNPKFRRRGVAQTMLNFIHELFKKSQAKSSYLELRRSNYTAYRLYKKLGYAYVGLRKGYYADNKEDAILMKKMLK